MSKINPDPFTTRPEIEGTFGVVTSTHWIATAVGMGILEKGGNAFDAGVATAFTLQVVEPHLNGPGGDVPIIVHDTKRGRTEVICGQGPAPAKATIAHYKSEGLEMVPGTGLLAACVPGTFESWMLLGAVPDLAMSGRQRIPVKGEIPNPIDPPPGCAFNPRCPLAFELCRRQAPALINGVACHAVNMPATRSSPLPKGEVGSHRQMRDG